MSANLTTRDVLVKARELIATPDRWTKGAAWRSAGRKTYLNKNVDACCSLGAIWGVCRNTNTLSDVEYAAVRALATATGADDYIVRVGSPNPVVSHWNDAPERTHDEVLAAFDRAIDLASEPSDA